MRGQVREYVDCSEYNEELKEFGKKAPRTDSWEPKWYELMNLEEVWPKIPLFHKIKGRSMRVEFAQEEGICMITTQLRENYPRLYRTNADVHRANDFIGAMIQKYCLLRDKDKIKKNLANVITDAMRDMFEQVINYDRIKDQIDQAVLLWTEKKIDTRTLKSGVQKLYKMLESNQADLAFAENYYEEVMQNSAEVKRMHQAEMNRMRQQRFRQRRKEAIQNGTLRDGLKVIDGGELDEEGDDIVDDEDDLKNESRTDEVLI